MKIIIGGIASGKTTRIIKAAALNDSYIVCRTHEDCMRIKKHAEALGLKIKFPITYEDILAQKYFNIGVKEVVIDNAEEFIKTACYSLSVKTISISGEFEHIGIGENLKLDPEESRRRYLEGDWNVTAGVEEKTQQQVVPNIKRYLEGGWRALNDRADDDKTAREFGNVRKELDEFYESLTETEQDDLRKHKYAIAVSWLRYNQLLRYLVSNSLILPDNSNPYYLRKTQVRFEEYIVVDTPYDTIKLEEYKSK